VDTCKNIHTIVIVKCGWHVFPGEAVGGVRDYQAGLTDRTVAYQDHFDPLVKRRCRMLHQVLILCSDTSSHRGCRRRRLLLPGSLHLHGLSALEQRLRPVSVRRRRHCLVFDLTAASSFHASKGAPSTRMRRTSSRNLRLLRRRGRRCWLTLGCRSAATSRRRAHHSFARGMQRRQDGERAADRPGAILCGFEAGARPR